LETKQSKLELVTTDVPSGYQFVYYSSKPRLFTVCRAVLLAALSQYRTAHSTNSNHISGIRTHSLRADTKVSFAV